MPPESDHEDHAEILDQFRQEVFEDGVVHEGDTIGTDDETLLRFLRARKFDLALSKKMIKDCQEWRRTVEGIGIDELYRRIDPFDYPEREAVFECWPLWFHKVCHALFDVNLSLKLPQTDKKGRPLNIHFFGGMDLPKLHKTCTPEKHWQTILVNAESLPREVLPAATRKAGKSISTVFVIVDLKGFGISQFWQMKSLARNSFQISQDFFPETMGQLAIVNAPPSFTVIWSVIRRWLSRETAEKVDVLGKDYKDVLLNLIDAESLPSSLGGTCECRNEGGCQLSGAGPWLEGRIGWGPKARAKTKGEKSDTQLVVMDAQANPEEEETYDKDILRSLNDGNDLVSPRLRDATVNGVYAVDGKDKRPIAQA
ncbi:CRAL-TRIO domain-containing protein [Collybia nuda]|uniref:CRAL-TRIO domain-containing protein n=1 Tax=Collybia nuda TaxID=64659 RepID=A0A9P6CI76_9AGAR|nr:CRAL-TRIO domain-containing protein [Collybia nuda]